MSLIGIGGNKYGPGLNTPETTRRVLDEAEELGINFIDTAAAYGDGESERYFGAALEGRRDKFVIATKTYLDHRAGSVEDHLLRSIDESLRKLRTDHVDLYQIHRADPSVPNDELMACLEKLIDLGKTRLVGCSNYASWRIVESNLQARAIGAHPFSTVQREYNLLKRSAESELFSACQAHQVTLIPYFPLASGLLWRGGLRGNERWKMGETSVPSQLDRVTAILTALKKLAIDWDRQLGELAIAWLAAHDVVGSVIVGVRSPEQLREVARSANWMLTPEQLAVVDDLTSTGEEINADDPFGRRPSSPRQ